MKDPAYELTADSLLYNSEQQMALLLPTHLSATAVAVPLK
jgi:hypothetical protein